MVIKQLFSNLAILIAIMFLYTQLTKSTPLSRASKPKRKILLGIMSGLLSNILMQYSINFGNTIIDLRHIPIILISYYGGALPSIIAMLLVILGRAIISINTSTYVAIMFIVLVTFVSVYISGKQFSKRKKIFWMLSISNLIFTFLISSLLKDINILLILIPYYWGISYLAGFISFYIVEYIRNSQELFNRYKSESTTDGLTGLNNVRQFDEIFNHLLNNLKTKNEKLSLLYIDIDFFKKINDTYGHSEGDIILSELGNILKSSTRSFDIVSRNGGEEFTVILLDCPLERAVKFSEQIRKNVEEFSFILNCGINIHITVSIGISCYDETTKEASSLIEDADKALYVAKRTGRNKVCVFKQ